MLQTQESKKNFKQFLIFFSSIISYFVVYFFFTTFENIFDLTSQIPHLQEMKIAVAFIISFGLFIFFFRNTFVQKKLSSWIEEYGKIVFPSPTEAFKQSIIILIAVIIIGFLLGLFDFLSQKILSFIK
jgi:preprotein translocase SecE subunit